ncbi:GNAT family N-acetyltransferase [Pseudomonas sp. MBLB4136]|uniref:GNAT family N-acetyltransferase n=1 Tax=Pseudomonas sp. MBLB4136 TaxID=3451558 RepID=UPI003F74BD78
MLNASSLANGLSLRPARASDEPFLQDLYRSVRPELQWIDGDPEIIHSVVEGQYRAQQQGTGDWYPNALHFVIEKAGDAIGAMTCDFGHNEVRLVYLAFVPAARGRGYGRVLLKGIQQVAHRLACPLVVVVWRGNPQARRLYLELGFQVEEAHPFAERLVWYPNAVVS